MIKTSKRIVAILLVVVMAISSFPIAAFAATEYIEGDYTYTVSDSKATIVAYPETAEGVVNIPSTLGGYPVTAIGSYAFWGCTLITEISIPASITSIGNSAFGFCTYLAVVNYAGTEAQWKKISIGSGNSDLTSATINYNSSGNAEEKGYPIIIIPGVMGSNLYSNVTCSDDSIVWLPDYENWKLYEYANIIGLSDRMAISKVLYVRKPENQVNLSEKNREYGARDEYKPLVDELCKEYKKKNTGVYFFSYDWRLSNLSNAERLNEFIDSLKDEKVNLVCHSMGGLVASSYVSIYGTKELNKVITCGTPYEGAPSMINKTLNWDLLDDDKDVVNGNDCIDSGLGLFAGVTKSFKKTLPAVAELFPTTDYVDIVPMWEDSWAPAGWGDKQISTEKYIETCERILGKINCKNAKTTHTAITSRNGNYGVLADYEDAYFIIGTGKSTICSIKFQFMGDDVDEVLRETDLSYTIKGDGTVPYVSATMCNYLDESNPNCIILDNTDHGGTAYSEKGIEKIINILNNNSVKSEKVVDKGYTVMRVACPVDVKIEENGDYLSSSLDSLKTMSSFGRVDFLGDNNEIKMICIENTDVTDVILEGTDDGMMDYSIEWYNQDDKLVAQKTYTDVQVKENTIIKTTTDKDNTILNVDLNGDGITEKMISPDSEVVSVDIQSPSRTEIRNKDGIMLHANVEGAPADSYVVWSASNGNFDKDDFGDGRLEIIAKNKGWTTFTATLCDADGNVLAEDTVEMYSKSGFFDKIGGFFRSLFGTTKMYDVY